MKKNITINLLGRLYAIDEDAYELLKRYTDSLRNYFARREGGEEIVDDIEARIAELFDELKQGGVQAITIEHVEDIIHRVGRPEEMEEEDPSRPPREGEEKTQSEENGDTYSSPLRGGREGSQGEGHRRLYRNLADRKFMGVLSGLAAYFGGDVLWWRLGYVALFFLLPGGFVSRMFYWSTWHWGISVNVGLVILYIALGILMPVADTPEDRLRMKGKPVNPQNLADEVSQPQPAQRPDEGHMGCLGGFFFIVGTLVRWFIYGLGIALAFTLLAGIVGLIAIMTMPHTMIHESDPTFWQFFDAYQGDLFKAALLCLGVLLIPTYCIIHSFFNEIRMLKPMGFGQRLAFLIIWIGLFIAAAVFCTRLVGKIKEAEEKSWQLRDEQYHKDNTHDGIFYEPDEWEFLSERGWRVLRADHCDRYTSSGQYYTGHGARYIDTYDSRHRQLFTIERTEVLQPGTYRLTACVRANGQGAYVYAFADSLSESSIIYRTEIPADNNTGGSLWRESKFRRDSMDLAYSKGGYELPADYDFLRAIAEANDNRGFGWNRVALPDMRFSKAVTLHYGVSTDPALTRASWLGQWFSACDFELKRIDEKQK